MDLFIAGKIVLRAILSFILAPEYVTGIIKIYESYLDIYSVFEELQTKHVEKLNSYIGYKFTASAYNKFTGIIFAIVAIYWYYYEELAYRLTVFIVAYIGSVIAMECIAVYCAYNKTKSKMEIFNDYVKIRDPAISYYAYLVYYITALPLTVCVVATYFGYNGMINASLAILEFNRRAMNVKPKDKPVDESASDDRIRDAVQEVQASLVDEPAVQASPVDPATE